MPRHVDILLERLRQFDEVTLLELLDIRSDDIVERFKDVIIQRREQLFGEIEEFYPEDSEEDWDEELDGFQIEEIRYEDDE